MSSSGSRGDERNSVSVALYPLQNANKKIWRYRMKDTKCKVCGRKLNYGEIYLSLFSYMLNTKTYICKECYDGEV